MEQALLTFFAEVLGIKVTEDELARIMPMVKTAQSWAQSLEKIVVEPWVKPAISFGIAGREARWAQEA